MDPFAAAVRAAVDACFRHLGRDAVFTPKGGAPVPVRVIAKRPDEVTDFGETRVLAETALFDLRVAEVADPRPGDQIAFGGADYVVQGAPMRDAERLVWTLEARRP